MIIKSAEFIRGITGTNSILTDGKKQIAFIGRSNVGKSSIINALLGRKELVKVGKKPGKTTEINFFLVNHKFYFVDLPGYGYAHVNKERLEKIRKLIIWYLTDTDIRPTCVAVILDIKVGMTKFDKEVVEILREQNHPYIIVANKSDKLNQKETADQIKKIQEDSLSADIMVCSAQTKKGMNKVLERLLQE